MRIICLITKHCKAMQLTAFVRSISSMNGRTYKVIRVMKLTSIFLLAACLQLSAKGLGQSVTLKLKDAPLEKVFVEIEKQTAYTFVYTDNFLQDARKVTVDISNFSIEKTLEICLKDQPFSYVINDKFIVIKKKEQSPNPEATNVIALIDISGKVTNEEGNPLSGASVKVKGTEKGTTTNNDGVFVLKGVNNDAVLEISFIGYQLYIVVVNNKTSIVANLKLKPENLDEVIINKGYYTEKQKTSVSNVARITAKDIEKQPVQNVLLALQGRVPGLVVTQNSSLAGTSVTVRVQGENSIANGNDPLYVVDGVPIDAQLPTTGVSGALFAYVPGGQ